MTEPLVKGFAGANSRLMQALAHATLGLLASAWTCPSAAQEPAEVDPAYAAHDAARVEIPQDYPARAYKADQLLQRFVELANGPELAREDLEREFGLRFVKLFPRADYDGVARGRYPLGTAVSTFAQYGPTSSPRIFVTLDLRDRFLRPGTQMPEWTQPKVCIDPVAFESRLGSDWRRQQTGGGDLPRRVTYAREASGRTRTVEISPNAVQNANCIALFSITYGPATGS